MKGGGGGGGGGRGSLNTEPFFHKPFFSLLQNDLEGDWKYKFRILVYACQEFIWQWENVYSGCAYKNRALITLDISCEM